MPYSIYNQRLNAAINAGFEIYCNTRNEDNIPGTILTNTNPKSQYNGECIDLFEDNTFTQHCQFKGQTPAYIVCNTAVLENELYDFLYRD